jgi:hypothetical protein
MLLDMYTLAYPNNSMIKGVIGQSGSATSGFAVENKNKKWLNVAKALGCGTGSSSVGCMRNKSEADVVQALLNSAGCSFPAGAFSRIPDGKVV